MSRFIQGQASHRDAVAWRRLRLWAALAVALSLGRTIAQGAEATPQAGGALSQSDGTATLQEIVVTASRWKSTVQSTPMSVTAVSGADLEERGIAYLPSLARSVPGIEMRTSGPGQTEFEMRGIASTGGNSPTVGFYLGDTPLTAPAATNNGKVVIDPNVYDLNRVEVVRGPQGTLYGSGSMGGTIKLVPNAPDTNKAEASVEATFGDTVGGGFDHTANAMLNLPISQGVAALRLVATDSYQSGWINRIVIANGAFPLPINNTRGNVLAAPVAANYRHVNDTNLKGGRASLLLTPTDRLSITPMILYQKMTQNGRGEIDSDPGTNAHYEPFDIPEPFVDRVTLESLNATYHFNSFDLTSTTSHWDRDEVLTQDGTEGWQWIFAMPSFYAAQGGLGPSTGTEDDGSKQTSEEIRLTSSTNSAFKWLVGYFYQDFESNWGAAYLAPQADPLFGITNLYSQSQPTKIIQNAFFANFSYQFTSPLTASAGLRRYSYNESVNTYANGLVAPSASNAIGITSAGEQNQGITPSFDLAYKPSNNLTVYSRVAKGFRPGGGNSPIPTTGALGALCEANLQAEHNTTAFVPSPNAFLPDSLWSYEIGEKARTTSNTFMLNGAGYYESWKGIQQNIPLPCGYNYQANAGNAHVYGGELEARAVLLPGLVLSVNGSYTHATIVSVSLLNAGLTPGSPVQDVPKSTAAVSLSYERPISDSLHLTARIENEYVGSRIDATYTINHLPSYDLTQLRAGIEDDRWSATAFADNVFNKRALLNTVTQVAINMPMYTRIAVSQPLTIGIDLTYEFGQ